MINNTALRENIKNNEYNAVLNKLYRAEDIEKQKERYIRVSNSFDEIFVAGSDVAVFSAPGRTEVCGNHTDHNKGRVLAASVNLDAIAVAAFNDDNIVRIKSEGYKMVTISELAAQYGYTLEPHKEYYDFYPKNSPDERIRELYSED